MRGRVSEGGQTREKKEQAQGGGKQRRQREPAQRRKGSSWPASKMRRVRTKCRRGHRQPPAPLLPPPSPRQRPVLCRRDSLLMAQRGSGGGQGATGLATSAGRPRLQAEAAIQRFEGQGTSTCPGAPSRAPTRAARRSSAGAGEGEPAARWLGPSAVAPSNEPLVAKESSRKRTAVEQQFDRKAGPASDPALESKK